MASDIKTPAENSPDPATSPEGAEKKTVSTQLRGETMAYAAQSAVYNLGANFFEPYINARVQKYYSGPHSYGSYTQNLAGEFAGDIIGSSTLLLAEAFIPESLHRGTRAMRRLIDPLYTSVAHRVFAKEKSSPDYEKKIDEWKVFHERNLVRSAIIATAGIAGNIATQKVLIGNPSPTKLIFAGKLASTALTTAIGLGVRLAYPQQMKGVDRWMSKNIFAPLMKDNAADGSPSTHADKLAQQNAAENLQPAR